MLICSRSHSDQTENSSKTLLFQLLYIYQQRETRDRSYQTRPSVRGNVSMCPQCFGDTLTGHSEHISLDLSGDHDATSPLGVVRPAQAGHIGHATLMDVHHTV